MKSRMSTPKKAPWGRFVQRPRGIRRCALKFQMHLDLSLSTTPLAASPPNRCWPIESLPIHHFHLSSGSWRVHSIFNIASLAHLVAHRCQRAGARAGVFNHLDSYVFNFTLSHFVLVHCFLLKDSSFGIVWTSLARSSHERHCS